MKNKHEHLPERVNFIFVGWFEKSLILMGVVSLSGDILKVRFLGILVLAA
jgi:hypothetical protein